MLSNVYTILTIYSRTELIQSLHTIDTSVCTTETILQLLKLFIVCGEVDEALAIINSLRKMEITPEQESVVNVALLRLVLEYPDKCTSIVVQNIEKSDLRWVRVFSSTGLDIEYPTELKDMSFCGGAKQILRIDLHIQCPACGQMVTASIGSELFPIGQSANAHWLCPYCLARREWKAENIRRQVFRIFRSLVDRFPKNDALMLSWQDAYTVLLCAKALRPLGLIRFGNIYSCRIGHLAANTSTYILERKMGVGEVSLDYLGVDSSLEYGEVANTYFVELWDRILHFTPIGPQLVRLAASLPDMWNSEHIFNLSYYGGAHSALAENPVHLPFTLAEYERALEDLERMGVPRNAKLVLFMTRDSKYMQENFVSISDAHNTIRNLDIDSLRDTVEYLAEQGYYCLRMGAVTSSEITFANDKIIDYARCYRSEFMDIWLFANSYLVLAGGTGPDIIPVYLDRNVLFFNYIPIGRGLFFSSKTTSLFRYPYKTAEKRYLSLEEMISSPAGLFVKTEDFASAGIELHLNSSQQICEAVKEKICWMSGETLADEDKLLQEAFFRLLYKYVPYWNEQIMEEFHGPKLFGSVSSVFLRRYREELLAL